MKKPLDRKTAVDNARYAKWVTTFSGYSSEVTRGKIELWIKQFKRADRDLAARILDATLFISDVQIRTKFKDLLNSIEGWNANALRRTGQWYFVPFSGSTGESADSMMHLFRMATGMTQKRHNPLFIHRSELVQRLPKEEDTVVFIDDFSGTGTQASNFWNSTFKELLPKNPRTLLLLVAATHEAIEKVRNETDMSLICGHTLDRRADFFSDFCTHFNKNEKTTVENYCLKADKIKPKGFGNAGLLVVLSHRCPNNSLPILHVENNSWSGLFPRHFD